MSSIDFPQKGLDPLVWDKTDDGYVLKASIKQQILDVLGRYPAKDLRRIAQRVMVVGSICTNQYGPDVDIDVHLEVGPEEFEEEERNNIKKWFDTNRDAINGWVGKHPIEIYIQPNPEQDMMSDGVYDLEADNWVKGPKVAADDYDPYEDYSEQLEIAKSMVVNADKLFGEIKRDIVDYNVFQDAMGKLSQIQRKSLLAKLEAKLSEIEGHINDLYANKKEWTDMRKQASNPARAKQDAEYAEKWAEKNAIFKFIARYKYMRIVNDLKKLVSDDGKITPDEVDKIGKIMGA